MNKPSVVFTILSCLFEIVLLLAVLAVFYLLTGVIVFHLFKAKTALPFEIVYPIIFIGAMFLGFFLYRKITGWAIKHFNLDKKIDPSITAHFCRNKKTEND